MSRVVSIDLDVNDAKAVRAWQRARDSIAEFDKQGQKTGKTFGSMLTDQVKGVTAMAAGFAGVGSVIGGIVTAAQMLRAEYDNIIQQQSAAAQANLTFEQSLAQAVRNASGIFEAADVRDRSLALASEANITPAKAAGIIGSALTSTGVTNQAEANLAIDSARAAAIYAPELDIMGTESLAGVAASGAKRFGVSPEAYIGFLQQVAGQSNIRELTPLIENVAPVLSNLTEFGFKPAEAGALLSTLTQGLGDTTGEMSGTAAVNLAKELRDRFGNVQGFSRDDGSFNPIAAMAVLQQDAELRKKFFDGGDFFGEKFGTAALGKGKAIPTIEGILSGADTFQARQMTGSYFAIGDFQQGENTFRKLVSDIGSVTPTEQARRILQSGTAGVQANDVTGISSVIREEGQKFQQAIGDTAIGQRFGGYLREFESSFGTNPVAAIDEFQTQLSDSAESLRRGTPSRTQASGGMFGGFITIPGRPATTRDIEVADRIDALISKLEQVESVVQVQVNVNNRPANADVRKIPAGGRHADLSAPPSPSRVSRTGGN